VAVEPCFLLSLPRSGSTLVQRVLASYPGVATASEPWILLPLLGSLRERLAPASAWHEDVASAVEDFAGELPGGRAQLERELGEVALRLYSQAAGEGARLFVDKTPDYVLIVDEIARVFPSAPLIFLFRNPLAVLASIVETFCDGRFEPYRYRVTLFDGVAAMVAGYRRYQARSIVLRYEQLLAGEWEWRRLADSLGLEFDRSVLERFEAVELGGRMGDPTGVRAYGTLSSEPLDKWRTTLASPLRRRWSAAWLRWIGRERLALMGYDLDVLLAELRALGSSRGTLGADARYLGRSLARDAVKARAGGRSASSWRMLLGAGERVR
jgi:Sulfotransferase family